MCLMGLESAVSAEGRRLPCRWILNRRWRWRRRNIGARKRHMSGDSPARGQSSRAKPPFYSSLKYLAPSALALLQLKFHGKEKGLFEENPVPPWCFLVALFVVGLIAGLMEQMQTFKTKWSQILWRVATASGIFSVVSLASMFLQYRMSTASLIICATLLSIALAWPILSYAGNLIHKRTTNVLDIIRAKVVCSKESNLTNDEDSPV